MRWGQGHWRGLALLALAVGEPSPAGDPSRQLHIPGLGGPAFLGGNGLDVNDGSIIVHPQSGASLVSACNPEWRPEDITQFKLVGKTISFTVDLSGVGCACNLAFYLISAPARDEHGSPVPGDNDLAPGNFYCDANKVGGQWCPEVDIMEANTHAFQATPHKCDPPKNGHYSSCDRAGCGQNTRDIPHAYGPGAEFDIDTTKPFKVVTAFPEHRGSMAGMVTTLQQDGKRVTLDHGNCNAEYYAALSPAVVSGMSLRITYWGSTAETMNWLDSPPCGRQSCSKHNARKAFISDLELGSSTGASYNAKAVPMAEAPPPAPVPPSPATPPPLPTVAPPVPLTPRPWVPPATTQWVPPPPPPPPPTTQAPVMTFDCNNGFNQWEGWTQQKKTWCCSNKGLACDPFDCFEHLEDWFRQWPTAKQNWCCQHKSQGCPMSPGSPKATQQIGPLRWSNHPEKCFTDLGGDVGKLVIRDCIGPNGGPTQIWQSIGDGTIRLAAKPNRCIGIAQPANVQNGVCVHVSSCSASSEAQQFSINSAKMKIQWKPHRHMCLDVTNHKNAQGTPLQVWECIDTDTDQIYAWPVVDPSELTTASPLPLTTSTRTTTLLIWQPAKVPPPILPVIATVVPPVALTQAPTHTTTTYTTTTITDAYRCDVPDLSRTTYKQRVWCCSYKHLGCPVKIPQLWRYEPPVNYPIHTRVKPEINGPRTNYMLNPGDAFRVTEGKEGFDGVLYLKLEGDKGWFFESKPGIGTMCVETAPALTATLAPYDCHADLDKWQVAWSASKKAWCCSYHHVACDSDQEDRQGQDPQHPQGTSVPFDCLAGYEKWKTTWTISQAAFCCNTVHRGCPEEPSQVYDCTLWFPGCEHTWSEEQRLWCCRHKDRACPSKTAHSDSDCHVGAPDQWDRRRRLWCCAYRSIGCPQTTAHFSQRFALARGAVDPGNMRGLVTKASLAAVVSCFLLVASIALRRRLAVTCKSPCEGNVSEASPPPCEETSSLLHDTSRP